MWCAGTEAFQFTDVTSSAGVSYMQGPPLDPVSTPEVTSMTGGAAAADYDGDGNVDLFVTRINAPDILFRNQGDGTFVDVTSQAFGATPIDAPTNGVAWADIDNDNDPDLYVTTVGSDRHLLYINNNGVFTEDAVARGAQVGGPGLTVYGTGVAFGDYDRDGYLDTFVTEWRPTNVVSPIRGALLHNRGAAGVGHFDDHTILEGALVETENPGGNTFSHSFAPRFADLDGDRNPDLAITSDFGTSRLFWNNGDAPGPRFIENTTSAGVGTGRNDMGSAVGDVNGDGLLDWFITDIHFDSIPSTHPNGNRLFLNQGDRTFVDATDTAGVRDGDWGWGAAMGDFDNDRDLDITMTNGFLDGDQFANDPMRLWRNNGAGVFDEVSASAGITEDGQGRGLLTLDYDNDGDLDIFVINHAGAPALLRNDTDNGNGFLRVTTVGTESNRDGIGARVIVTPDLDSPAESMLREIEAGSHFLAQSERTAHFGLGASASTIDEVLVLWPSGYHQRLVDVPANVELIVTETPGDFNGDGLVNGADYTLWRDSNGTTGDLLAADANGDGMVDSTDYAMWAAGFGQAAYTVVPPQTSVTVPEPSSAVCVVTLGGLAYVSRRRRP